MSTPEPAPAGQGIVVVTPVRGRLDHLVNQRRFLDAVMPEATHVVVAVDMADLAGDLDRAGVGGANVIIVHEPDHPLGMPTARARNRGVGEAVARGADLVVLLDVDCVPLPGFAEAMTAAAARFEVLDGGDDECGAVLNGIVTYLPEGARLGEETPTAAARFVDPHAARPAPARGEVYVDDEHRLLWSLAFAVTPAQWRAIGGFDETYVGYGAEDTDFGMRARAAGLRMGWVGGAQVLHQWHPSANPPVHHVVDIVRNANLYRERWGVWPMEGWLRAFAERGLVDWTPTSLTLVER